MNKIKNYLKLMRVKHYIKNLLIFFPLVFSGKLFKVNDLLTCIYGFIIFSLACSIIYIVNDLKDIEKDKLHFKKKNRPLAKGDVSKKEAIILIIFIFLVVTLASILYLPLNSLILLLAYLLLNLFYSFGLKNIPILDIAILTSGFIIRVLFGGFLIDVEISNWLILTITSISFYLSLGKRRNEISAKDIKNNSTRTVLKYYNKDFLDKNMYMFLGMAVVFYSLWTIDMKTNAFNHLVWSVPFLMIIVMRYSMVIESDSDGDPVEVVFKDKILLLLIALFGILLIALLYLCGGHYGI